MAAQSAVSARDLSGLHTLRSALVVLHLVDVVHTVKQHVSGPAAAAALLCCSALTEHHTCSAEDAQTAVRCGPTHKR